MGDPALRTPAALLLLTVLAALPGLAAASEPGATVILRRPGEAGAAAVEPAADPYAWLEEIDGERAMEWVRRQNARTAEHLKAQPRFDELYRQALAALDSETRIPQVTQRGKWLYDFWKDEQHPRGIYRRTTLEQLRREEPEWQVVLDVDALAAAEGKPWVFKGTSCLPPAYRRCLVDLSPGGGDAVEVRELDAETLQLVPGG
ncbi:MAG TPA: S9 family peptidase, partial [Thermoanaerobaculia bacterium]|nr:S9 family peptidase [Thermoanaerobaculia bacterium]